MNLKLCSEDSIVNTIHGVFRANIIRVPEKRLKPLAIILKSDGYHYWGNLPELADSFTQDVSRISEESPMAEISGKSSKNVNADLGLSILDGFLSGMNLPSAAICSKFAGAKSVSFSFSNVRREYITPLNIGRLLRDFTLDQNNPANTSIIARQSTMFIIDSVIMSNGFNMSVGSYKETSFSIDIEAIKGIVSTAESKVRISNADSLNIKFEGPFPLNFAFSCLRCKVDAPGQLSIVPGKTRFTFGTAASLVNEMLFDSPTMIDII